VDLGAYILTLERSQGGPSQDLDAVAPRSLKMLLPPTLRESLQARATRLIRPFATIRARRFRRANPLRLHLGCGGTHLEGWINIDLLGLGADIPWDLRHPLPFAGGSADAVFHEHLLEHLPLSAALPLLRECWRVLRPNGLLRVGVPDAGRYMRDYGQAARFIETVRPGRPTSLLAVAEVVYGYGHLSLWDGETLCLALSEAGFVRVTVRPFGESAIDPVPDAQHRAAESIYVEGTHPELST
jgi:SAM-dependent methyltransferase